MKKAILALFANPQNNIKLFLDGRPVQPSSNASEACSLAATAAKALGFDGELMGKDRQAEVVATVLVKVLLKEGEGYNFTPA